MSWVHRPTWEDSGDLDRQVWRDGRNIGRVMYISHGLREGQWKWCGQWRGHDNQGRAASFELALEAIREAFLNVEAHDPDRLRL